jgi:archaellum component FlaF (FlaF/FlaG flagellin family)
MDTFNVTVTGNKVDLRGQLDSDCYALVTNGTITSEQHSSFLQLFDAFPGEAVSMTVSGNESGYEISMLVPTVGIGG